MNLWIDTADAGTERALFGLPPLERLRRSMRKLPATTPVTLSGPAGDQSWPGARRDPLSTPLGQRLRDALADGPLVALDGGNAVDPRLVAHLLAGRGSVLAMRGEGAQHAVALRLEPALAPSIPADAASLRAVADALLEAGHVVRLDEHEFPAYVDKLRRSLPYWLYAVDSVQTRQALERRMFWDNYKGSTDLLTRWVYPPLVWPLVRLCTRLHIHPNAVTVLSIVLAFAAVPLFAAGDWAWGFLCAYGMSVLDSVDGKIARVTLTDSALGNVLDHGLDQVHPPFWYIAWAWGLGAHDAGDPLMRVAIWFVVFYFGDRIVLGIARHRLGFGLHAATPLDGRVRSVIARRNITMTVMAVALLFGIGPTGLIVVTAWQGLTLAWHAARTILLGFLSPRKATPEA
jgi:phosphatidylglycerophosphate synthase